MYLHLEDPLDRTAHVVRFFIWYQKTAPGVSSESKHPLSNDKENLVFSYPHPNKCHNGFKMKF